MSTGLELEFIESAQDEWYYVIENWGAPKGAWDWREHATAYGPFKTREEAEAHYRANNANAGGCTVASFRDGWWTPDATWEALKKEADARAKTPRRPTYQRW